MRITTRHLVHMTAGTHNDELRKDFFWSLALYTGIGTIGFSFLPRHSGGPVIMQPCKPTRRCHQVDPPKTAPLSGLSLGRSGCVSCVE